MTPPRMSSLHRVPIPARDQSWLHMDRPNNLMYIQSMMWFDTTPDWDRVADVIRDRAVDRFPVLRSRAVQQKGEWFWEEDPRFDLERHLVRTTLPTGATTADVRRHISSRFGTPLKWDRPLWTVEFVSGVPSPVDVDPDRFGGEPAAAAGEDVGALVFWRFHHAIADGIRCTQLLLSLCDLDADPSIPTVGDRQGPDSPLDLVGFVGRHLAGGAVDAGRSTLSTARNLRSRLGHVAQSLVERPFQASRLPVRTVEAVSSLAAEDNTVINTWRSASRLLLEPRTPELGWSGTPTTHKHVGWIADVHLTEIKRIARSLGGTVNDVVLTAVSMALTTYLREQGEAPPDALNWMVPVSLQPLDPSLPAELGNHFSLVLFRMPLGHIDPRDAFAEMQEMMNRSKHSLEPQLGYVLLRSLPLVPEAVAAPIVNLFANKSVGQITNVPGPQVLMSLAGTPVHGVLGWVPLSGDQPIGICIFSYNGDVSFGVAGDAALIDDPQHIADLIREALTGLGEAANR